MLKYKLLVGVILAVSMGTSQVSISDNGVLVPDSSSVLELTSVNKGMLIPSIALVSKNAQTPIVSTPKNSLLVYNTATSGLGINAVTPGFYYWRSDISEWERLLSGTSTSGTDDQNLDSMSLNGTLLTGYIENGTSASIDLRPIVDSAIMNASGSDDQNLTVGAGTPTTSIIDIEGSTSDVTLQSGSNIMLSESGNTITISAIGDGTGTDDQNLTVGAGTPTTSIIDIEGSTSDVTLQSGSNIMLSESGNTITISALGDGTGTDDQNLTLDAGSANTSILNLENGTDIVIQAGSNITLSESSDTLTITASGGGGAVGYDTVEYLTGKTWIDGKPVYERVLNNYTGATGSGLNFSSYFPANYIDHILDMRIISECGGQTHHSSYGSFNYNGSSNSLSSSVNANFSSCGGQYTIILEYTRQ